MSSVAAMARDFIMVAEDAALGFGILGHGLCLHRTTANLKAAVRTGDREHFELQLMPGKKGLAVEIGWHAEHRSVALNDAALASLLAAEKRWRRQLPDAVAGGFAKGAKNWRRVSEVWDGMSFDDGVAVEAAEQLVLYVEVLSPLLATPHR